MHACFIKHTTRSKDPHEDSLHAFIGIDVLTWHVPLISKSNVHPHQHQWKSVNMVSNMTGNGKKFANTEHTKLYKCKCKTKTSTSTSQLIDSSTSPASQFSASATSATSATTTTTSTI